MDPLQSIILIGAVVIVGAFIMPKWKRPNSDDAESMRTVQGMETALEQLMEGMEKDNEDVMKLIASAQEASKKETEEKDRRIAALEARCEQLGQQLERSMKHDAPTYVAHVQSALAANGLATQAPVQEAMLDARPVAAESVAESMDNESYENKNDTIQARFAELFELYQKGKSIEAIAKNMGLNKGEVQLIIQLAKQEGARRD